ncbi:conserved hypothetical protein [Hyella patelloides LEGE 07179]|uniref:Uncharacterized protein n=1 Tax=Hyella patelloides LEGE 07179 TaxID=945734 RepID=A0A563W5L1_9CYAN|nr:hypothetical protein [Hyella patelloides]VEP18930.1 conserved hypothetical protein [Hyella patelloides LEGE 07179]
MKKWKLKYPKQCQKCPWKKSTNPFNIPDRYSEEAHRELGKTIADEIPIEEQLQAMTTEKTMFSMACHKSTEQERYYCIG